MVTTLDDDDEDILAGDDSADEYNPDEVEQTMLEEDSDSEGDLEEDDLIEDDLESTQNEEEEGLDSGDEIIDFGQAAQTKKATVPRGIESFTVKMNSEGELEAISSLDPENVAPLPGADPGVKEPKPRGRPRKKPKLDSNPDLVAIGRVIAVMEDEDPQELAFKGKKIYSDVKSNPRSLLLKSEEKTTDLDKKTTVRLILFCSVCEAQCDSQAELKHHAATHHKGSKFFVLPKNNPHRNCAQCTAMMSSYEEMVKSEDPKEFSQKDICFPCPHCRRRYVLCYKYFISVSCLRKFVKLCRASSSDFTSFE